jgi:hypothetical protein
MMITQVGSEEQVARWIEPTVRRGALLRVAALNPMERRRTRQRE